MTYADLTVFIVGFIGFVASLIEIYNFVLSHPIKLKYSIEFGSPIKKML